MLLNALEAVKDLAPIGRGMIALAAAIAVSAGMANALGEAKVAVKALDAMMRTPEQASNIRNTMILGISLVETTAIYGLLIAILLIFVLGSF